MNENRRQILNMLAASKITAEEAERLLTALESNGNAASGAVPSGGPSGNGSKTESPKSHARYLRVLVEAEEGIDGTKGPTTVNIRVPMQLLRAGVRLASLIPAQAHQHLDEALSQHGVPLTLSQIKPENLEELIDHLDDLTIDVAAKENHSNVKVKVFSE
jgi:SHOCT-like protein